MLFKNGIVFLDGMLKKADVRISGSHITAIAEEIFPQKGERIVSLDGKWLLPGFLTCTPMGVTERIFRTRRRKN